jgi:hypothetical protein
MNAIAAPFKQLVERRLWPLAVLLVAAIAAVPMLLSKEPAPPAPVTSVAPNSATAEAALATQPIVTVGDGATRDANRKVLGARKDPFEPEIKAKKAQAPTTAATPEAETPAAQTPSSTGTGGSNPGTGSIPTFPTTDPVTPAKTYPLYSVTVRWGQTTESSLGRKTVRRLRALPSTANPVVIYLGLLDDKKTAVFLVDHSAFVQGDGDCEPTPQDCQTLHLQAGETAFFDIPADSSVGRSAAQYQLDLVTIRAKKTTDAKALTATAKGGREALRARMGRVGRLRYDAKSGTVKRISSKAYKAEMSSR